MRSDDISRYTLPVVKKSENIALTSRHTTKRLSMFQSQLVVQ